MTLEFIPDITSTLDDKRRSELAEIAKKHYDSRFTLERMIENLHSNHAYLNDAEMLCVESELCKRFDEDVFLHKPVVHGIRIDSDSTNAYNEILCTQFVNWDGAQALHAQVFLENPDYLGSDVSDSYIVGIEFDAEGKPAGFDSGTVKMSKEQHYCIAKFEIFNPCGPEQSCQSVNRALVYIKDSEKGEILSSTRLEILNVTKKYYEFIKFDEAGLSERGKRLKMKLRHSIAGLAGNLPEIEFELRVSRSDDSRYITKKMLRAKCLIEKGEAVYVVDEDIWDQRAFDRLSFGEYMVSIFLWGECLMGAKFNMTAFPLDGEDNAAFEFEDAVGKSYNKVSCTQKDDSVQVKQIYDYIKLDSLNLFRQDYLDGLTADDNVEGQTTFKAGFNCDIAIYSSFEIKQKLESADEIEVTFNLYDSTGRLIQSLTGTQSIDKASAEAEPSFFSIANFTTEEDAWPEGTYRIEATAWGETIISIKFEICDKDSRGMYDPAASQPRLGHGGRKIVKEISHARQRLDELIGLKRVKEKIAALGEVNRFGAMRQSAGLSYKKASLHACFIGGSGTGKTTVANLIGQIYKEMGLLSSGHVVYEERSTLIGRYYDSELRETERALRNAKGGVLFIDEAYGLHVEDDPRDPGHKVIEALLTALSDEENRDWMLVLAGYPDDMEKLMNSNQGLKSRVNDVFYFDDMSCDELVEVADLYCRKNDYLMTPEAHRALESVIARDYASRSRNFGNARYVNNLLEKQIIPAMASRLCSMNVPSLTKKQIMTIEKEDVPAIRKGRNSKKMSKLEKMVGLDELKQNITSHLNFIRMVNNRMSMGLHTSMPPLHMIFTGNPGTGKSTVADFMGEIYASMGILSHGEVIKVEKRDLVGQHVGETEEKMNQLLDRAKGNVLFIDEAYQLWSNEDSNDYGKIVLESLLAVLANDQLDMIVILAGYTKEMEKLIEMNSGIKSRFPYTFNFEDYSAEELMEIAELTIKNENFILSASARKRLAALIKLEVDKKEASFGNARFVKHLISTKILPAMAGRLARMKTAPTEKQLMTISAADIPISADDAERVSLGSFDEAAIEKALKRLDAMVGLWNVKKTIHNFVEVARYMNSERQEAFGNQLMKWNFVGNSGTGKSTVAEIMAEILKAMGLIGKEKVVELKGEEFYNVPEYRCDEILRKAMEESKYSLLFVDSDAPMFKNSDSWALTGDQLRIKLAALTAEIGGNGALIIAECESPRSRIVPSLAGKGVFDLDRTLVFNDYSSEELFDILCLLLKEQDAVLSEEAAEKMRSYIDSLCNNRSLAMANARTMKLLAQSIVQIMLVRESRSGDSAAKGLVTAADVDSFEWHKPYKKIGF